MSFKERSRSFWSTVNDDKCAYEQYDEKKGFTECNRPAKQIHHIKGERETLLNGSDPERNVGMPVCEQHHVRNTGEDLGEKSSSFHPDVGRAYQSYGEWKNQEEHMRSITGRPTTNYSTSPFASVEQEHKEKSESGQRYISGDNGTDAYYEQKMRDKATRYLAEHPGEKKPETKPHPRTDVNKKKHWWDNLF